MTNQKPGDAVINFGRIRGMTVDEVARTDRGLLQLDKLLGILPKSWTIYQQIASYLQDPTISKELSDILDSREL